MDGQLLLYHIMLSAEKVIKIIEDLTQLTASWTTLKNIGQGSLNQSYNELQLFLLQECDRLNYHKNTKYLAKTLFDMAAIHLPQVRPENGGLYLLTALSIAIKFNQSQDVADQLTLEEMSKMTNCEFQAADFIQAELEILELLEFQLHLSSPYDYACLFNSLTEESGKNMRERQIESIIDFAIILPQLTLASPKLFFMACFLNVFSDFLGEREKRSLSKCFSRGQWRKIEKMASVLDMSINELGGSQVKQQIFN